MDSPHTPSSVSSSKKFSKIYSFTPTMIKRSNVPPLLNLQPISPPPTIKKQRIRDTFNDILAPASSTALQSAFETPSNTTSREHFDDDSPLFKYSKQNGNLINENCSICSESLRTKLSSEKILKLKCSHSCHYYCFLLYHEGKTSGEKISDFCCSQCGEADIRPANEDEFDLNLFSSTQKSHLKSPIDDYSFDILPEVQVSGFKPNFTDLPFTPNDQTIKNYGPQGFRIPLASDPSTASSTLTGSGTPIPSPRMIDLSRPNINVISFKNGENISNVINVFTNELQSDSSPLQDLDMQKEKSIKVKIHNDIVSQLSQSVKDDQGIDFKELQDLKMFDSFEISIDGVNWEFIHSFIFDDVCLILINEEMTSVMGSIMLRDHFCSFTRVNEFQLIIYLNSSMLPELQIRSMNTILISKYEDYFTQLTNSPTTDIPLIQMTTTLWSLVSSVPIPQQIQKFNELSLKGLDLPINLLRSVIPKPQPKPTNIILIIQLFNTMESVSNEDYLQSIKDAVRNTLDRLSKYDKMGLVIQGRDGQRVQDVHQCSYLGMVSRDWSGWDELIDELRVYSPTARADANLVLKNMFESCLKLSSMIDEEETVVKELIWLNNLKSEDKLDSGMIKKSLKKLHRMGICLNHFELSDDQEQEQEPILSVFTKSFINELISFQIQEKDRVEIYKNYDFKRFNSFKQFNTKYVHALEKFKRIIVSNIVIRLSIPVELRSVIRFKSFEFIDFNPSEPINEICITLNALHDGFYKNLKFDLELIDPSSTRSIEIAVSYRYNKMTEFEYTQKFDSTLIKDKVLVKREIEMMTIDRLKNGQTQGLKQLIFDSIKGCSTKHLDFFKMSEFFLSFKNLVNYVDELVKRIEGDSSREQLVIELQLESLSVD